jgi:hypothetical protein
MVGCFTMSKLEDLRPNASVQGILPNCLVTVISTRWFGSEALELTCKNPGGKVANELLHRHDEPRIEVERYPWMRWDQIDFEDGTWTNPSSLTKQKSEHRVLLSAPAWQLLFEIRIEADRGEEVTDSLLREAENERTPKRAAAKRRAAAFALARKNSAFVFPGRKSGAALVNMRRVWEDVCERAKLPGIRVHDLRHSYTSLLASSGLSLPIIGALLGHTQASTTQRHAHMLDDPLRTATERVGAVIVGGGKSPAEVVEIGRR